MSTQKPREYFWVPERAIFDSGGDACEFMDLGPGCLVASHVAYDDLKRDHQALQAQADKLAEALDNCLAVIAEESPATFMVMAEKTLSDYNEWRNREK